MSIFETLLVVLVVIAPLVAALAAAWRAIVFFSALQQALRRLDAGPKPVVGQAPPAGAPVPAPWAGPVQPWVAAWSQADALQRARTENRKAELMSVAARAGFPMKL